MNDGKGPVTGLRLESLAENPRQTAHEYVRDAIRQGILRGDLVGGTRLVQAEIARELGVSTTPVREALRDLATEGMVRLDAHRGAIVNRLTFEDLREVVELCRLVEPEAIRQVVRIADQGLLARARKLADQMRTEADSAHWAELNRDFHGQLVEAIPSERLRNVLRGLRDSAAPYVALALRHRGKDQFELANEQHAQILDALTSGDADRCAELMRTHVDLTLRAIDESRHRFTADGDRSR